MSRRAKPTASKETEGRAGARKALASDPTPTPAVDAEPTIPLSARGRELFDAARRELEWLGMLGSLDVPVRVPGVPLVRRRSSFVGPA
jgi:hypothetical protein